MNPVFNHRKLLEALSEEFRLKDYWIKVVENPKGVPAQCVVAKNEAQAVRIARRYLKMKGTLEIYDQISWDERLIPGPRTEPHYYEDPGSYYQFETPEEENLDNLSTSA